ncbi:glycosyltransferase [Balneola sp. MJW-20]|uniref:glycosyltransferase n=1 Tax=Gracilimonas aurantiaca TaxID=3234185 RepID=UPI0034661455
MKILYFTESYPYGLGEQWKTNELKILVRHFEDIEVIPFHYNSNHIPVDPIKGITYHKPLFEKIPNPRVFFKFWSILKSKKRYYFFKEFFKKKIFTIDKFKQWVSSSFLIDELLRNEILKEKLLRTSSNTIAYFFWGRKSAEIIPLINNSSVYCFVRLHGYDLYDERYSTRYIPYQDKILHCAHKILTVSNHGKEYLISKFPSLRDRIKVSYLGTLYAGHSKYSLSYNMTILSCSSIIPLKRVSLIASALQYIKTFSIEWIHIGSGPCRPEVESIAKDFSENVKFKITGWLPSSEVRQFYQENEVDLFINVSESEGVPVSIMEAMSSGVPVLATDVGGVSEIVNNNNGKLLDPSIQPEDLAKEITKFFHKSNEEKLSMRKEAYNMFKEKYDAENNALKLVHLFNSSV